MEPKIYGSKKPTSILKVNRELKWNRDFADRDAILLNLSNYVNIYTQGLEMVCWNWI